MMRTENDKVQAFHFKAEEPEIDRLLRPAKHYRRPDQVVADGALTVSEKRAILSSWASDACAVESLPAFRQWPGSREPVTFDEIMDALQSLDSQVWNRVSGGRERQSHIHASS